MPASPAPAATLISASAWLALACSVCSVVTFSGCGNDAPPPNRPPPGIISNNPPMPSAPQPVQGPDSQRYQPLQPPVRASHLERPPTAAKTDSQDQAPAEKQARDYSAELSELLRSTVSCLTGHKDAHAAITINVSAQVMPSGAISRADAQGAGLTPVELSCIQKLVGELRLNGPIDAAPRSVAGHLTLQAQATKEQAQPKAAAEHDEEDRDENPRDSKVKEVNNDPPEVQQRDEPVREPPEAPEPREEPPHDTPADQQP